MLQILSTNKDIQIEVTKVWKLNTPIILVVIGSLCMIKKGAKNHGSKMLGGHQIPRATKVFCVQLRIASARIFPSKRNVSYVHR